MKEFWRTIWSIYSLKFYLNIQVTAIILELSLTCNQIKTFTFLFKHRQIVKMKTHLKLFSFTNPSPNTKLNLLNQLNTFITIEIFYLFFIFLMILFFYMLPTGWNRFHWLQTKMMSSPYCVCQQKITSLLYLSLPTKVMSSLDCVFRAHTLFLSLLVVFLWLASTLA